MSLYRVKKEINCIHTYEALVDARSENEAIKKTDDECIEFEEVGGWDDVIYHQLSAELVGNNF